MTYSYSFDEEQFYGDFPTVEDAIAEALDGMDDQPLYVGENKRCTAHHFVGPHSILEQIAEQAYEEEEEGSEGWLVSLMENKEKLAELKKLVGDWIQANDPPQFYTIVNPREITPEEIEEATNATL